MGFENVLNNFTGGGNASPTESIVPMNTDGGFVMSDGAGTNPGGMIMNADKGGNIFSNWGDMSKEGKIATGGMIMTGLLGVVGNMNNLKSANLEAEMYQTQGDLAMHEALLEADRTAESGAQFQAEQKMKYLMSGVRLQGTPIQMIDDTGLKVQDEIRAIKIRGMATQSLYNARAQQLKNQGRTAFLAGLSDTGKSVLQTYTKAKQGGVLDKVQKTKTDVLVDTNVFDTNVLNA